MSALPFITDPSIVNLASTQVVAGGFPTLQELPDIHALRNSGTLTTVLNVDASAFSGAADPVNQDRLFEISDTEIVCFLGDKMRIVDVDLDLGTEYTLPSVIIGIHQSKSDPKRFFIFYNNGVAEELVIGSYKLVRSQKQLIADFRPSLDVSGTLFLGKVFFVVNYDETEVWGVAHTSTTDNSLTLARFSLSTDAMAFIEKATVTASETGLDLTAEGKLYISGKSFRGSTDLLVACCYDLASGSNYKGAFKRLSFSAGSLSSLDSDAGTTIISAKRNFVVYPLSSRSIAYIADEGGGTIVLRRYSVTSGSVTTSVISLVSASTIGFSHDISVIPIKNSVFKAASMERFTSGTAFFDESSGSTFPSNVYQMIQLRNMRGFLCLHNPSGSIERISFWSIT
jgi:hypothetical protein